MGEHSNLFSRHFNWSYRASLRSSSSSSSLFDGGYGEAAESGSGVEGREMDDLEDDMEMLYEEEFGIQDTLRFQVTNSSIRWEFNATSTTASMSPFEEYFPGRTTTTNSFDSASSPWETILNHSAPSLDSPLASTSFSVLSGVGGGGFLGLPPSARTNTSGYLNNLAVAVPMGVSLYALSLLTFVGNAMVLHAIRTERRLQTVSNMFIMSLAIADLTVGMIVMPISSAYAITGDWKFGIVVCQFWLSADYSASTASILNLLILSLDRYWSIRSPLKYMRKRTKKRALIMIGFVWLLSSMWIIPIIGWHYWYNDGIRKQPSNVCETEFADNVLFKLTTSTANFYVPMVLMIAIYVKIFYEIKKRSKFEIGQCNVGGGSVGSGSSGSTLDVTTATGGLYRNGTGRSFRETTTRRENVYTNPRTYSYGVGRCGENDYPTTTAVGGGSCSACASSEGRLGTNGSEYQQHYDNRKLYRQCSDDTRFQHLTLLSLKTATVDSKYRPQHFEGVSVNVEYVQDSIGNACGGNGSEEKDVAGEHEKRMRSRRRLEDVIVVANNVGDKERITASTLSMTSQKARGASRCLLRSWLSRDDKESKKKKKKRQMTKRQEDEEDEIEMDQFQKSFRKKKCKKHRKKEVQEAKQAEHLQVPPMKTTSLPPSRLGSQRGASIRSGAGILSNFSTLRMKVTRRNMASNLRQEKKAARQLGVIMGAFVLCWLPYIIIFIVTAYCEDCINHNIHTAAIWLGYLNSTMNPFLYALCNANFKRAFKKMFRRGSKNGFYTTAASAKTDNLFA